MSVSKLRVIPEGSASDGPPKHPLRGKSLGSIIVVLLVLVLFGRMFFVYVRPNEYGIKEVKVGVNRGIQSKVQTPGYAFVLPFGMEVIHRFPRNVQVLELTDYPAQKSDSRYYDRAAKIQTSDGFYVDVDVSILYRIVDPYKLITQLGPGLLYLHNGILPKAEPILKQALGELTTEDFYNSPLRVEKTHKAREMLDAEMADKGLHIDHVLVRYFKYSDEIQRNIEEKKLQDQLVFKNQAEAKAAMEEAKYKEKVQEGEMQVIVAMEEGKAYEIRKRAEQDLYFRKKTAEADLLVQLAEARATELENEAMLVLGSDRMVAREMADVLNGLEMIIIPSGGETGLNPLDLQGLLDLFGVKNGGTLPPAGQNAEANMPDAPAGSSLIKSTTGEKAQ